MVYRKGDKPLLPAALKEEVDRIFAPTTPWTLIAMGRGFYTLKFGCSADLRMASRRSTVQLSTGVMYLREWTPDFDPFTEQSSMAHVWVKAYNLPAFYWHPQVLTGLLSAAGKVIKFDGNTMSGTVGQFVRALVEVDLAQPLLDSVKVGCGESSFLVDLVYENLPFFCSSCKLVGHTLDRCHKNKEKKENKENKEYKGEKGKPAQGKEKVTEEGMGNNRNGGDGEWRRKGDKHRSRSPAKKTPVPTHNSFQALEHEETAAPSVVDLLERVTVDVVEGLALDQPVDTNTDKRLHNLERRMQADRVVSSVVRKMHTERQEGNPSNDGLGIVRERLELASTLGAHPTEFELNKGGSSELVLMDKVAKQIWADEVEAVDVSGGFPPEKLAQTQ